MVKYRQILSNSQAEGFVNAEARETRSVLDALGKPLTLAQLCDRTCLGREQVADILLKLINTNQIDFDGVYYHGAL